MGTNVDCYQRAEGKYRLMRGIISALRDSANPFSILTEGTLVLRDLDLLTRAAEVTEVGLNVSAGIVDKVAFSVHRAGHAGPGAAAGPASADRAGLRCGVLMGPIVPFLSDSPEQLDAAVRTDRGRRAVRDPDRAAPAAGHARVVPPLAERQPIPELVRRYPALLGRGASRPRPTE